MGNSNRRQALVHLLKRASMQGYVTFDEMLSSAETNHLPIQDFDWLTDAITSKGILVYDSVPTSVPSLETDEYDDFAQTDYEATYDRVIELSESLEPFISRIREIIPPQSRELAQLKYQVREGNAHARDRMIEMHLRVAVRIALQRSETYDMDIEDAVGYACLGLVIATDKYDPDANGAFSAYASMWILQTISREQSTRKHFVYYPVYKKDKYFSVYPDMKRRGCLVCDELRVCQKIREQICEQLCCSNEEASQIIDATQPFESYENLTDFYLDNCDETEKNACGHSEEKVYSLTDNMEEPCTPLDAIIERDCREKIFEVLEGLSPRERRVVIPRYGLDDGEEKTLEYVGRQMHVTRERIRQIEAKAIKKLQHPLRANKIKDFYD